MTNVYWKCSLCGRILLQDPYDIPLSHLDSCHLDVYTGLSNRQNAFAIAFRKLEEKYPRRSWSDFFERYHEIMNARERRVTKKLSPFGYEKS